VGRAYVVRGSSVCTCPVWKSEEWREIALWTAREAKRSGGWVEATNTSDSRYPNRSSTSVSLKSGPSFHLLFCATLAYMTHTYLLSSP